MRSQERPFVPGDVSQFNDFLNKHPELNKLGVGALQETVEPFGMNHTVSISLDEGAHSMGTTKKTGTLTPGHKADAITDGDTM